jgi:membrane protein insertase Oxa1/YidC/SpoIIIJ
MSIRYEQVNLEEKVAMLQSNDLEPFYEPKKESECPSWLLDGIPIVITFLIAIIVIIAIVVIVLFPPTAMQLEKVFDSNFLIRKLLIYILE